MMSEQELSSEITLKALTSAMPYIKEFKNKVIVIKYGGSQLRVGAELDSFADDIMLLRSIGINVIVVHGGGPQINEALKIYGKEPQFNAGLRVTDKETLNIARMVLVGRVGRDIVNSINRHGGYGVGITGEDGQLFVAEKISEELGYVGEIKKVNASIIERMYREDLIPIISTIGVDEQGQSLNINADQAAAALAIALGAEKLIIMSNIPGLLKNVNDPDSVISELEVDDARRLIESGEIAHGMIPKLASCVEAVESGVRRAHIIDGRQAHSVLMELFTNEGVGTMFYRD